MDLTEFITARLDEDEAAAKAASSEHLSLEARDGTWQVVGKRHVTYDNGAGETLVAVDVKGTPVLWYEQIWVKGDPDMAVASHIAIHDPARALREVEAKRAIVRLYDEAEGYAYTVAAERAVVQLAAVYSDHPDYQPGWAPDA